jgi:hypothetical protein
MTTQQIALAVLVLHMHLEGCPGAESRSKQPAASGPGQALSANPARVPGASVPTEDDLAWLVGRWKCVGRQYFTEEERRMAASGDSLLDYFNVYFPYADDRLTLALTENPDDRPIAAEFVARQVHDVSEFRENPRPMFEGGPVRIGRQQIWYGPRLSSDFDFRYWVEQKGDRLWLILQSKAMRFELVKLFAATGNIRKSFVSAPVRDYSKEHLLDLEHRYAELKKHAEQKTSSRMGADSGERKP